MKREVQEAITASNEARSRILANLTSSQRVELLEQLFEEFFVDQHLTLQKWAALTGQSAQVDTGYIAQFVASICLGIPGQGFRGKGDDLIDGSEVKAAANTSGVDRPRWNHNLGTPSDDDKRRARGLPTASEQYLSSPYLFYLLVDRVATADTAPKPLRVRAWCIDAQADVAWRDLVTRFVEGRVTSQYNLQLHPPVGYDDNLVVNTIGNLDFADVLLFDARIVFATENTDGAIEWVVKPTFPINAIIGRTRAAPYVKNVRPSNLTGSEDLVADIAVLPQLFPGVLSEVQELTVQDAIEVEAEADAHQAE